MNFVLTRDPRSGAPLFENRSPKSGERPAYAIPGIFDADGTEQREFQSYAAIAIVPNVAATETAILIEGLNMQATEAGGEILTNPERLAALLRRIGIYKASRCCLSRCSSNSPLSQGAIPMRRPSPFAIPLNPDPVPGIRRAHRPPELLAS
jgi:hypothetical protein